MTKKIVCKKGRAWLITWEKIGGWKKIPNNKEVIGIRDARTSDKKIFEFIEYYYISHILDVEAMAKYIKNKKHSAIQIKYGAYDGVPNSGIIEAGCGQNPYIKARIVTNLIIFDDDTFKFEEFEFPKISY